MVFYVLIIMNVLEVREEFSLWTSLNICKILIPIIPSNKKSTTHSPAAGEKLLGQQHAGVINVLMSFSYRF